MSNGNEQLALDAIRKFLEPVHEETRREKEELAADLDDLDKDLGEPNHVSLTVQGLEAGSRAAVIDPVTGAVIEQVVAKNDVATFQAVYTQDKEVTVRVRKKGLLPFSTDMTIKPSMENVLTVQQQKDLAFDD